ncbi:ABC transporter substrate-binding protein [Neptunicella sp. SCSIO 80796]
MYDIVAEGISMVSSLQSEFEPVLRKEGLTAVIQAMSHPANIE